MSEEPGKAHVGRSGRIVRRGLAVAVLLALVAVAATAVVVGGELRSDIDDQEVQLATRYDRLSEANGLLVSLMESLDSRLEDRDREIRALRSQVEELEDRLDDMEESVDDSGAREPIEQSVPEEEAETSNAYVAPDPATVSQFIRSVYRDRLGRDPSEEELRTEVDWYMTEDQKGGDTAARWLERFDRRWGGYIEQERQEAERRQRIEECERDKAERQARGEVTSYPCV